MREYGRGGCSEEKQRETQQAFHSTRAILHGDAASSRFSVSFSIAYS
jgi:hypothetical protein